MSSIIIAVCYVVLTVTLTGKRNFTHSLHSFAHSIKWPDHFYILLEKYGWNSLQVLAVASYLSYHYCITQVVLIRET